MAAIICHDSNKIPWGDVWETVRKDLPMYARPVFFRVTKGIPVTSTFKYKKAALSNEGVDHDKCCANGDVLYHMNCKTGAVILFNEGHYKDLKNNNFKL